jgi:hypothetical protein
MSLLIVEQIDLPKMSEQGRTEEGYNITGRQAEAMTISGGPHYTDDRFSKNVPTRRNSYGMPHEFNQSNNAGKMSDSSASDAPLRWTVTGPSISWRPVSREIAQSRLAAFAAAKSKTPPSDPGTPHRYTFQNGDQIVDKGPERYEGIRPPSRDIRRREGFARGCRDYSRGGRGSGGYSGRGYYCRPRRGREFFSRSRYRGLVHDIYRPARHDSDFRYGETATEMEERGRRLDDESRGRGDGWERDQYRGGHGYDYGRDREDFREDRLRGGRC